MTDSQTIAVTGGAGFLGAHVLRRLRAGGHTVKALTRQPRRSDDDPLLTWIQGSLSDREALADLVTGTDVVVHMAGAIKALSRSAFFAANRDGTRALVDAARNAGVGKFVLVSSLAAREPALSPYAASKRAGEFCLEQNAGMMDTVVLRPPAIYGPGDRETARLFQMAANGFVLAPSGPDARVSMIHAADAASAVEACCVADQPARPLEIGDGAGDGYTWTDLAEAASGAVAREVKLIRLPDVFLWSAGAFGTLSGALTRRPAMLTLGKVPELLHPDWVARGPLPHGWEPQWTLKNGFKDSVEWCSSQNILKRYF